MTLEEVNAELDLIESKIADFCFDCDYIEDCGDWDYAYGAPAYQHDYTCPGCLDPDDYGCPLHKEFVALKQDQKRLEAIADGICE